DTRVSLTASVREKGVLLPLIVRPLADSSEYEVIAGDTRRAIVAELVAAGEWPADREVPIIIRMDLVGNDVAALDVAVSENLHVPVHPMDQFSAFKQLVDLGRTVTEVANSYGVS